MEVVAVLAHELGHWANWDTTRQLFIAEVPRSIYPRLISGLSFCVFRPFLDFYREWEHVPLIRFHEGTTRPHRLDALLVRLETH
jgi:Zn-dependent protease with chaperone function